MPEHATSFFGVRHSVKAPSKQPTAPSCPFSENPVMTANFTPNPHSSRSISFVSWSVGQGLKLRPVSRHASVMFGVMMSAPSMNFRILAG